MSFCRERREGEGGRKGAKEGGKEGGREGGREGGTLALHVHILAYNHGVSICTKKSNLCRRIGTDI